jgi:hypothetical protein
MTPAQAAQMGLDANGNPLAGGGNPLAGGGASGMLGAGAGLAGGNPGGLNASTSLGTDPNVIANKGLTTVGTALDKSTAGLATDTTAATTAGTSWFNFLGNLFSGGTGIFARVGVGMLALIFIGFGLWMASREHVDG